MSDIELPQWGESAPEFALPSLEGAMCSLADTRARGAVVVHFVREFT